MIRPPRRFALVLHTHLPWVLHHGRWPHGADWLSEAVAGSYLPLLRVFTRRAREGRPLGVTLGLSPVLCEQLAHPDFADEFRFWVENRLEAASDDHERFEAEGRDDQTLLARRWERFYRGTLEDFFGPHGTNLVARFRRLEESGAIEIITCAATHGYLPLLGTPGAVERQIAVACRTHRRHFGRDPRGIWLPECAYRPPGPWVSPLGARWNESWRAGVDEVLAKHGLEFFFVDAHLVADGAPLGISSPGEWRYEHENAPSEERGPMPRGAFAVEPSGIACFARDVPTASQVWSREGGYPGDPDYLDFHKRHHASGLRYWAVTDPRGDLAGKRLYRPTAAHARARVHARHLLELVAGSSADDGDRGDGTTCAMYDTELFGHWWFEGPEFLGRVFDGAAGEGVRFESAGAALDRGGASDRRTLREGSWGEGGAHQVWLNPQTRGVWSAVHAVERRFERAAARLGAGAAGPLAERAMRQAAREVLLLEASDWPFLITNGSARDYARDRVRGHAADALRLVELALRWATGAPPTDREVERLAVCEARDSLFADLDWRPD